ncbi:MAG: thiL [Firmicutes bacterium]|nr:thiL [Bacillota bacterium]
MKLSEVGEFGLIDLIKDGATVDQTSLVVGIGDDAAVYVPGRGKLELLTTDMLVEKVHFDLTTTSPWQLGYKAVAVSLSDIAAMGGKPKHIVVSLALTVETSVEYVVNLYSGIKEICREYSVNLVGGDTVSSPEGLVINVAVTGEVEPAGLLRRSGAKPGDLVAVTGYLGNSACGFDLLRRRGWEDYEYAWPLVTAHLTPRPQVALGQSLAAWGATSANDISDGLASEANELAKASGKAIKLYSEKIPLSPELVQAAALFRKKPLDYALYGGEDYQLVFTISPEQFARLPQVAGQFSAIGEVAEGEGVTLLGQTGKPVRLNPKGYNHFR